MKIIVRIFMMMSLALMILACEKSDSKDSGNASNEEGTAMTRVETLKNSKNQSVKVLYFAENDQVAVKITTNDGIEHTLKAKGTNENGDPIFTDGKIAWEMMEDGHSGRLTDAAGSMLYQ